MKHTYWETEFGCDFRNITNVTINGNKYELYFEKPVQNIQNKKYITQSQEIEVPVGTRTAKFKVKLIYDKGTIAYKVFNYTMDSKEDVAFIVANISSFHYEYKRALTSQDYVNGLKEFGESFDKAIPLLIEKTANRNNHLPNGQDLPNNVLHVPFRDGIKEVPFKFRKANGDGSKPSIGEKSWLYWEWEAHSLIFTIPIATGIKADISITANYMMDAKCDGVADPSHCDWVSEAEYYENMEKAIKRKDYSVSTKGYVADFNITTLYINDTAITDKDEIRKAVRYTHVAEDKRYGSYTSAFKGMEAFYKNTIHPAMLERIEQYKKEQSKAKRQAKKDDEDKVLFEEYKKNRDVFLKWLKDNQ